MEILYAIILGIIQGLTEFLPVSSSGHLEIGKALLGDQALPKESLLFTVVLHFATALSTVVVFKKEIGVLLKGLFSVSWNKEKVFSIKIVLSMIPAGLMGLFFESELERLFAGNIIFVGFMLIITALLLYLSDNATYTGKSVSYKNAFVIGVAQAIAILPGISRSGSTIATSVLLGNDKEKAARFSFLMVVPLIFGKILKDIFTGTISFEIAQAKTLTIGFITAFIAGIIACSWMIQLVKKSRLTYFAIYCFVMGIITIILGYY